MSKTILLVILCLVEESKDYLSVTHIFKQINTLDLVSVQLKTIEDLEQNFESDRGDIYLIDYQYFHERVVLLSNQKPIIVLVDDVNCAMKAIALGATDYIEKKQLTLTKLERSLHLSLARVSAINKRISQARLHYLTTLVALETQLLNYHIDYSKIVELLGRAVRAERVSLLKYDRAKMSMNSIAEWLEGIQTASISTAIDSRCIEILERGEIIKAIAAKRKDDLARNLEVLILPVNVAGQLFGAICLENSPASLEEVITLLRGATTAISLKLEGSIAETRAEESREKFRTIFNRAGVGIAQVDLNNKFLLVNQKLSKLTGLSNSELMQLEVKDITHPEDVEKQILLKEELLAGKIESFAREKRYIRSDGTYIWVKITVSMVRDRSQQPKYIIQVIEDINDRKIAEEALKKSEKRLHSITDSLPVCIAYIDAAQRYQFVNQNYYRWFGFSPEQIIGGKKKVTEVLGEKSYRAIADKIERVLQGEQVTYESIISCVKGDLYVSGTLVPDFDKGDRVIGYYSLIADITPQKLTEDKLRASEALYAGLFNHSADGIFSLDISLDGEFIYEAINPTYQMLTGTSAKEVVGKTISAVMPKEMAAMLERLYRSCLEKGEPISYEKTLELPGGKRIWRTILVPIRDRAGKIIKLQGSARDITQEKQTAANQLRFTRHQRLLASLILKIRQSWQIDEILQTVVTEIRRTLNTERVMFVRLDRDNRSGKIVNEDVAPGFPSIVGETLIDDRCYQECRTKYRDSYMCICSDVLSEGFDASYLEFLQKYQIRANLIVPIAIEPKQIKSADSTEAKIWGLLWVQQCSHPRKWKNEEIELLQQLADRLTIALYQAELLEEQERQRQELKRSNAELEQFAYVASHDLQEPLQTIGNYAQLLQRRYREQIDAKADKYIYYIVDGVARMQRQINDLLEYSRIGKNDRACSKVDCNLVFKQAIANLQLTIRQHQAVIISKNLPKLKANFTQILQLFQNLIGNALKYHRQKPPVILIQATPQENGWLFSITDNGIGIDSKHKKRIFQIFQRLHPQDEYPGTGIGLAICEKIVKHHGGKIWVDSQPNSGSTFYFTLTNSEE